MAAILQTGIGTLAFPFYVLEFARDPKPTPAAPDATLYVLETRETYVWKNGAWVLFGASTAADATMLAAILTDLAATDRKILRELRLIRAGQIEATTCKDMTGQLDDPESEEPLA